MSKIATECEEPTKNTNISKFSKNITTNIKSGIPSSLKNTNDFLLESPLNSDNNTKKKNNIIYNKVYLDLEVINSWILPKGLLLHINNEGLENSLRNMKDGITYFGFIKDYNKDNHNSEIDYIINPKDEEYDERYIGRHFKIEYYSNVNKYYIQDLGFGFGTFIKIIDELKIKDNYLVNIGETYLVFTIDENNKINIKIFSGNEKYEPFSFNNDILEPIYIGRDCDCIISIEDKRLSRIHCTLNYNNEYKYWFLKDGGKNGFSTNGTWLYAAEEYEIYDGMIFKTNHNLFKCKYKYEKL
jgi:hypothetical protein